MAGSRLLLRLVALIFVGFGLAFLGWPVALAGTVELLLPTATAVVDVRATYGGFDLGFGLFLFYCAAAPERVRLGLVAGAFALGGFALGRMVGLLVGGPAGAVMYYALAVETTGTAACLIAARGVRAAAPDSASAT